MIQSSFPEHVENVATVVSSDISVTWPTRQTVLVSHGSVLFVRPLSSAVVSHSQLSQE
jgi:hypothetical protein